MSGKTLGIGPLSELFNRSAPAKILDFLVAMREFDYSESDIARNAGVGLRTVSRELPKLVRLGLVEHTRIVGRSRMFRLAENTAGRSLGELALSLAALWISKVEVESIQVPA